MSELQEHQTKEYAAGVAAMRAKEAGSDPEISYGMTGRLHLSKTGWLLLSVPNALGRGAFQALNVPGAELPIDPDTGMYNAHISVARPEELATIGGGSKITERGKEFAFTLGPVREVIPEGWPEMSRVWFITAKSPELQDMRKSYGLTPLPQKHGKVYHFHITFAVKRRAVTQPNGPTKQTGPERSLHKIAQSLDELLAIKDLSDQRRYKEKHLAIQKLLAQVPSAWKHDSNQGPMAGITHKPTGFKYHVPPEVLAVLKRAQRMEEARIVQEHMRAARQAR